MSTQDRVRRAVREHREALLDQLSSWAASVPTGSGSRYVESVMTSSFTKLLSPWPRVFATSLPSRATPTASSAVVHPAVFGSSQTLFQSIDVSSMLVTAPSTRRTATVTTSASDAAIESAMSCAVLYLPVPRNRRELNVLPAMTS